MGAEKGIIEDANQKEWPATLTRIKERYPDIKKVIPGHGNTRGPVLLDYTAGLFSDSTHIAQ